MSSKVRDYPEHRVYADERVTVTRRGFMKWFPTDPMERAILIGNWIMILRHQHPIIMDYMWRWIEAEFPAETLKARELIAQADMTVHPNPFVE